MVGNFLNLAKDINKQIWKSKWILNKINLKKIYANGHHSQNSEPKRQHQNSESRETWHLIYRGKLIRFLIRDNGRQKEVAQHFLNTNPPPKKY